MGKQGDEAAETANDRHDEVTADDFPARLREVVGHETVRSFARRAEVSHSSLGQYLNGTSEPSRPGLVRLAAAGEVRLEWLAMGEGPMKPADEIRQTVERMSRRQLLTNMESSAEEPITRRYSPQTGRPAAIPILGLAECGLKGWYRESAMEVSASRPGDLHDPETFAVIAVGVSMRPAGILEGFLCFCSPATSPAAGDRVYVERRDGTASIKVFRGADDEWLHLRGWLPPEDGRQDGYEEQVKQSEVVRLATVVYIKVKL